MKLVNANNNNVGTTTIVYFKISQSLLWFLFSLKLSKNEPKHMYFCSLHGIQHNRGKHKPQRIGSALGIFSSLNKKTLKAHILKWRQKYFQFRTLNMLLWLIRLSLHLLTPPQRWFDVQSFSPYYSILNNIVFLLSSVYAYTNDKP